MAHQQPHTTKTGQEWKTGTYMVDIHMLERTMAVSSTPVQNPCAENAHPKQMSNDRILEPKCDLGVSVVLTKRVSIGRNTSAQELRPGPGDRRQCTLCTSRRGGLD